MTQVKLTPKQKELIERLGVQMERSGAPPAQSRIMALLLVCDKTELAFEEIIQLLQLSKSAVSNALNSLLATERLEYITRPGDRRRYFRSCISQWEKDLGKKMQEMLAASQLMREVLEQRPKSTPEFNNALKQVIDFMSFLQAELPAVYTKWIEQQKK
jgi:DNA-binding transcriptional regulator GbsR (MarR family)